jgi:hypothetical protein
MIYISNSNSPKLIGFAILKIKLQHASYKRRGLTHSFELKEKEKEKECKLCLYEFN